ncbi:MAG: ABC transporter permease, partial [Blastocatellia bacterium]
MEALLNDLRFAFRLLITRRAFSVVALLMIALGIGANTAVFSLLNAVLLRPLPGVERPDRVVTLLSTLRGNDYTNFSYPDYLDIRNRNHSFAGMCSDIRSWVNVGAPGGTPERVRGDLVTGNYFSVLGVKPEAGRLLTPTDDAHPDNDNVVALSYSLWKRMFNA